MIRTAAVFSDNMVLQRGRNVRIFGTFAPPCSKISVSIPELGISADASLKNGSWEALLPPMNACDCCTVVIKSDSGNITFCNVAVGEVWLAGGQSNMEFELQNEINGASALAECSKENVRFYYTPKCAMLDEEHERSERESCWKLADSENSRCWSAVGYYFARELSRRLGVAVGIIGCNKGGTSASVWVDRNVLERDERLRPYITEYDEAVAGKTDEQMIKEYNEYIDYYEPWCIRVAECYAENPDMSWDEVQKIAGENRYPGPMGCANPMRPCGMYETMLRRVSPYTIAGIIYYQGESDDHRPDSYGTLFSALISKWRQDWQNDTLPFIFVQLPMFKYRDDPDWKNWAVIREKQMDVYRAVKNTGIAVAIDCGEFNNIHPVEKARIAHRLYLQAMYHVYGECDDIQAFPPVYRSFVTEGDAMRIYFDHCDGFEVIGTADGFELAGDDGEFCTAEAEICGNEILLHSDSVAVPRQARYMWTNYAEVHLFGRNGIPVPPFRTK